MSEETDRIGDDRHVDLKSGVTICFREAGSGPAPAILLIAGLGEDLTSWPSSFVGSLVASGFRVIIMDNRDVGRSTFGSSPAPSLWRRLAARPRRDSYHLTDMADDCNGVLDHLGIPRCHLVGRSMGGMIAQTIAATRPDRVASLTSLYSTTGASRVGQPALSTIRLLMSPAASSRTAAVRAHLRVTAHIAGQAYPIDDAAEAIVAARGWDRSAGDPAAGIARQIQAIQASGDRTTLLHRISAPTLVINGDRDLMVASSGGEATVRAIRSAQHVVIPGMGHHMPEVLVEPIAQYIAHHAERVDAGGNNVRIS